MVEQSDTGKCHYHIILVTAIDDCIITNGAAGLSNILYAALSGSLDIIEEREECIRAQSHFLHSVKPRTLLLCCKYRGLHLKDILPGAVSQHIHVLLTDVKVNGIVSVSTADLIQKLQVQNLRSLTQIPVVSLLSCQSGTMDTRLLSCTDTDSLSALYVANRVGLGIF